MVWSGAQVRTAWAAQHGSAIELAAEALLHVLVLLLDVEREAVQEIMHLGSACFFFNF